MEALKKILDKCRNSTGRDFENDDTFRLHYKTAQELIKEAYKLGTQNSSCCSRNKD